MAGGAAEQLLQQCLALWAEDSVLYWAKVLSWHGNGKQADVLFTDYDNVDVVSWEMIFKVYPAVPAALLQPETVDRPVDRGGGAALPARVP